MNPQIVWEQLLCAYAAGNWDSIEKHATELLAWLDRGDMPPKILKNPGLGDEFNRAVARSGCLFALEAVQGAWRLP